MQSTKRRSMLSVLCKLEIRTNKLVTAFFKIYLKLCRNKHIWQFKVQVAQCVTEGSEPIYQHFNDRGF